MKVIGGIAVVLVALIVLLLVFVDPEKKKPGGGPSATQAERVEKKKPSGGPSTTQAERVENKKPSCGPSTTQADRAEVARTGEPVVICGIAYTVVGVRRDDFLPYEFANGVYVVVDVRYHSVSNEPADGSLNDWLLLGRDGETYTPDFERAAGTSTPNMEPGSLGGGRLVFDVPPRAARGARLIAQLCEIDLQSEESCSTRKLIDLGLR